jgi:hypothetical protein
MFCRSGETPFVDGFDPAELKVELGALAAVSTSSSRTPTTVVTPPPAPLCGRRSATLSSLLFFLNATNHPKDSLRKLFLVINLSRISEIYPHGGSITITGRKTLYCEIARLLLRYDGQIFSVRITVNGTTTGDDLAHALKRRHSRRYARSRHAARDISHGDFISSLLACGVHHHTPITPRRPPPPTPASISRDIPRHQARSIPEAWCVVINVTDDHFDSRRTNQGVPKSFQSATIHRQTGMTAQRHLARTKFYTSSLDNRGCS